MSKQRQPPIPHLLNAVAQILRQSLIPTPHRLHVQRQIIFVPAAIDRLDESDRVAVAGAATDPVLAAIKTLCRSRRRGERNQSIWEFRA
jgi:hypothetical protein